jgi:hypothetical protein
MCVLERKKKNKHRNKRRHTYETVRGYVHTNKKGIKVRQLVEFNICKYLFLCIIIEIK